MADSWEEWEIEHRDDFKEIDRLRKDGHPHHCVCRQVWGDGECERDLYKKGYNPYAWMDIRMKSRGFKIQAT